MYCHVWIMPPNSLICFKQKLYGTVPQCASIEMILTWKIKDYFNYLETYLFRCTLMTSLWIHDNHVEKWKSKSLSQILTESRDKNRHTFIRVLVTDLLDKCSCQETKEWISSTTHTHTHILTFTHTHEHTQNTRLYRHIKQLIYWHGIFCFSSHSTVLHPWQLHLSKWNEIRL